MGNSDFTHEVYIPTDNRPITRVHAMEMDHHGIVDLSFGFPDGTSTPWAFQESLPAGGDRGTTGAKVWAHSVPNGRWACGIGVRTQHHFGVIDLILRVSTSPVLLPLPLPATLPAYHDPPPWEMVLEPKSLEPEGRWD